MGSSDLCRLNNGSGAAIVTPLAFDATITGLALALFAGQARLLPPEQKQFEVLIERYGEVGNFRVIKLTPSHLEALNQLGHCSDCPVSHAVSLLAVKPCLGSTFERWRRHMAPHTRLINYYGPTEATCRCVTYELQATDPESGNHSDWKADLECSGLCIG